MPEVAEPPPVATEVKPPEYVPPVPQEKQPLKAKLGDVWKAEFEKAKRTEGQSEEGDVPKAPELPKEKTEPEVKSPPTSPEPEVKPPAADQLKSPLDVVTAEKTPEKEDELDELKDIPVEIEAKDDKQKANWKALRTLADKAIREARELKGKIETTPKAQPDEILAIAKERDEFKAKFEKNEEALKGLNYQLSESYQSLVADRDNYVNKMLSKAGRLGIDNDKFMAALAMPEGKAKTAQIREALATVDPEDLADAKTEVRVMLDKLDEKNEKLAEEAKNSSSRWEELSAKRAAEVAEEQAKGLKTIESEFTKIASMLPETVKTFREVPGDEEWNAEIKAARETAMRVLTPGGSDQKESMEIALKGSRYDSLERRLFLVHNELAEARKRLAEYDSGGPEFKGGMKPKTEAKLLPSEKYHKTLAALKSSPTE